MESKEDIQTGDPASEQVEGEILGSSEDVAFYGTSGKASSSPARIEEIDISVPARALGYLRLCDYGLVVICGSMAVISIAGAISSFIKGVTWLR